MIPCHPTTYSLSAFVLISSHILNDIFFFEINTALLSQGTRTYLEAMPRPDPLRSPSTSICNTNFVLIQLFHQFKQWRAFRVCSEPDSTSRQRFNSIATFVAVVRTKSEPDNFSYCSQQPYMTELVWSTVCDGCRTQRNNYKHNLPELFVSIVLLMEASKLTIIWDVSLLIDNGFGPSSKVWMRCLSV